MTHQIVQSLWTLSQVDGLDAMQQSSDYILLHQGDTELLLASLLRIQATASSIIGSL